MTKALSPSGYPAFLAALKDRIVHARTTAARAVSRELVLLYWDIGQGIVEKQRLGRLGRCGRGTPRRRFARRVSGHEWFFSRKPVANEATLPCA